MKKKSEESNPNDPDPEEKARREYLKTVGALVAGLAVGGAAAWFGKPPETVEKTVTAPGATVTVPGPTVTHTVTASPTPTPELEERYLLAQKYKNANPGEKFLVGYIVWSLAHGPPVQDYQGAEQACKQMDLDFKALEVGTGVPATIEGAETMIAAGAKGIVFWAPAVAAIKEIARICNDNKVFAATSWCRDPEALPGDAGPYWFLEYATMSDEMSFETVTLLMEKMRMNGKTKLLHVQSSKTIATDSTSLINLGIAEAWRRYPEIELLGHYWGEWEYEAGRKAGEEALAVRTDYEALWGHNDDQCRGTYSAFKDRGINIGPYTASRDAIPQVMELLIKGEWFVTSLTEFPHFGGRRATAIYDACTGYSYPLPNEMIQSPKVTTFMDPTDPNGEEYVKRSGLWFHPNFMLADPEWYTYEFIPIEYKYPGVEWPYDFRLMSVGKCKELGLTYDRHGGNTKTQNDWYNIPEMKRFGSVESFRKQFGLILQYFLDLNVSKHTELMNYLKTLPPELKVEPFWG